MCEDHGRTDVGLCVGREGRQRLAAPASRRVRDPSDGTAAPLASGRFPVLGTESRDRVFSPVALLSGGRGCLRAGRPGAPRVPMSADGVTALRAGSSLPKSPLRPPFGVSLPGSTKLRDRRAVAAAGRYGTHGWESRLCLAAEATSRRPPLLPRTRVPARATADRAQAVRLWMSRLLQKCHFLLDYDKPAHWKK